MPKTKEELWTEFGKVVKWAEDRNKKLYVGIDPGSEGAVAVVCEKMHAVVDIPTVERDTKTKTKLGNKKKVTEYDYGACVRLLELITKSVNVVCVLEKSEVNASNPRFKRNNIKESGSNERSTDTPLTAHRVAWGCAMWIMYVVSRRFARLMPPPRVWKKSMGLTELGSGATTEQKKELSLDMARPMFPNAELHRKSDHNRAEALLLAEYGRRNM